MIFIAFLTNMFMGHGFFRPTKYKLILFVILMLLLFFVPIVPVTKTPVINPNLNPQPQWTSDSLSSMTMVILGVNTKSFGVFSGATSSIMSSLYLLVVGYLFACIILYGYHKMHS